MQLVAADIGNSSIKLAVEHAAQDRRWSMETVIRGDDPIHLDAQLLGNSLADDDQPALWCVSSVNRARHERLAKWVASHRPHDTFHLITAEEVPLETRVASRQRLGRDRLLAAWEAVQLNQPDDSDDSGPLIVIDAGTAVTIDWVDEQTVFRGGLIFPGARSMLRGLALQTDALPNLDHLDNLHNLADTERPATQSTAHHCLAPYGSSTESAITLGVLQTQIQTMRGVVSQLADQSLHNPTVFVTGGGIEELLPLLPESWQFVPDLVLTAALEIGRRRLPEIQ
jgi:type III pantothenate kinase